MSNPMPTKFFADQSQFDQALIFLGSKFRSAIRKSFTRLFWCAIATGGLVAPAFAQSTFITTSGTQQWGTASNWTPSGVPNAVGASVIFNSPSGGNQIVNLSPSGTNSRTVGAISITNNSTNTFLLNNGTGGSLILDATSGNAAITVGGTGNVVNTISATTTLNDTLDVTVNNVSTTVSTGALSLSGIISGNGGLRKLGSGTLSLQSAAKTYTGATEVLGGVLRLSEIASTASSASMTVNDGAQLRLDSNNNRVWTVSAGTVTLNGTGGGANGALRFQGSLNTGESQSFSNTISLATTSSIHVEDADGYINLTGGITGAGGLIKRGSGTLRLDASANYFGDTTVVNGNLRLFGAANRLPTGTTVSLGDSGSGNLGTLDLNSLDQQVAGLNSTIGINATTLNNTVTSATAATLTLGGSGNYSYGDGTAANSGVITGAISVVKSGAGTQTFGDTNTYTGSTTVNGGKLVVASTGSISHSASNFIVNVAEAQIDGSLTAAAITLNNGAKLTGNGSITTSSGLTIGGGGTVSGNRTITGNVTVDDNGKLSPGNSPGTITITGTGAGNLVFNGDYDWEVDPTLSPKADLTVVDGNLDWGATAVLNIISSNGGVGIGQTYSLFAYKGTFTGTFGPITGYTIDTAATSGGLNATGLGGGYKFLNITGVPEPTSGLLIGIGTLACFALRRNRRSA